MPGVAAPVTHKLRVRFGECDPQGVVFNANYLMYIDIGMTELFRTAFGTLGGYQAMVDRSGLEFVVAEARLSYRRPARFDEELALEIAIERLGTTSMTTAYRLLRDGELLLDGTLRHVLVDPKGLVEPEPGMKTAIPDWMREGLARHLEG
jgi:acyl-CoA thioester hydrolase